MKGSENLSKLKKKKKEFYRARLSSLGARGVRD